MAVFLCCSEKPAVTINSEKVQLGSKAILTCSSTSHSVKDLEWRRQQKDIGTMSESDKYSIKPFSNGTSILTIMDIEEDDFGAYQCVVTDDKHVNITVTGYVNHTGECVITTPSLYYYLCYIALHNVVTQFVVVHMCVFVCVCTCACVRVCVNAICSVYKHTNAMERDLVLQYLKFSVNIHGNT